MPKLKVIGAALLGLTAALLADTAPVQAQDSCAPFSINVPVLQVLRSPDNPGDYISVLQQGDIACVTDAEKVGPQQLGFVSQKTDAEGTTVEVGGWASTIFMTAQAEAPAAPAAAAAAVDTTAPSAAPEAPDPVEMAEEDILRFDQPVPYGVPPVRGSTLAELIEGIPMFPPIEGLPDDLWQKTCSTCHQWNQQRLCEQGQSYLPRAAAVFRHQHPYGGPYKLSLMRWAKTGCQ